MLSISRGISHVLTRIALSTAKTANRATIRTPQLIGFSAFHTSRSLQCAKVNEVASGDGAEAEAENIEKSEQPTAADLKRQKNDRSQVIPVETSMRYLKSAAYKQTYGDQYVWEQYRRNHKGAIPPKKTRKTCIRKGVVSTGNPCPICRDEYLVLDYRNTELLRQFISPQTGKVLSYSRTGLCQKKNLELLVAVERAKDYGLITFDVPFREYDYSEFYDNKTTTPTPTDSSKKPQA